MQALTIAWKDLVIFFKDRGVWLQLFLLPLLFIVIFSGALSAVGQGDEPADTRIPLPVVNLDGGPAAQTLLDGLERQQEVRLEPYATLAEAQALLAEGKIGWLLVISADFSAHLQANQPTTLRLINHPEANAQRAETVRLAVENITRNMALENQILISLQQMSDMLADAPPEYQEAFSFERVSAQARSQFEQSQDRPLVSVRQTTPATGGENAEAANSNQSAVPGFTILFVFLAAQATARSIYDEKKVGSFRRLLASPLSKAALLAGKVLPNFLTAVIQMIVIFTFSSLGLRWLGLASISLGRDPLALALGVVCIALCSSSLGLVIAALAHTENQIGGVSSLLLWVLAIVGGAIIPSFALEMFLGPLPRLTPHYWAIRVLENLLLRGQNLAGVSIELAALLGFTALFFVIGLWRFDFNA